MTMRGRSCSVCGVNIRVADGVKTSDGSWMCPPCFRTHVPYRTCTICSAEVLRKDCHKNRYGEYICRPCQSKGYKYSVRKRAWLMVLGWRKRVGLVLLYLVLALVGMRLFYSFLDHYSSTSNPTVTLD